MTTEEKIREAYDKFTTEHGEDIYDDYVSFKAGYLALLNSLEYVGENKVDKLYALPEGVTRD